jgi:DNA-binding transcriptional regulator YdaS (Cro superfamily)
VHCAAIEAHTGGEVRRWDLRPNDWHRIWPELIGAAGAPDVLEAIASEREPGEHASASHRTRTERLEGPSSRGERG